MFRSLRPFGLLLGSLFALMLVWGCNEPERRKVTYTQEEQHGEVEETSPGEMVVE